MGVGLDPDRRSKLFGTGLSRTGTLRLTAALRTLGYTAVHDPYLTEQELWGDGPLARLEPFDALLDAPIPALVERLDHAYPGCRFIHTVRPLDDWLDACERFFVPEDGGHGARAPSDRERAGRYRRFFYGREAFDRVTYRTIYLEHEHFLGTYFAGRPERLLRLDVGSENPWRPLCRFLDIAEPELPFPRRRRRRLGSGSVVAPS